MKLHELPKGNSKKSKKRVGRGHGSGSVKTSGRGQKGQTSRSGGNIPAFFQGGGLSMYRRMPKLGGFNNINKVEYTPVNVASLNCFEDGTEVTVDLLKQAGIIRTSENRIKILARGEITKKLKIQAHAWSKEAEHKVTEAGSELIKLD